jgi:uracil-DNA glycosylase
MNEELKKIKEEVIKCNKCPLASFRAENNYFPVIGQRNHDANIVFVGEAPGVNEAKTGIPFCGSAGRILNELLESISIKREDVYICNILKDRPPNNRDPQEEEIASCFPYLLRQIEAISPKVVCTLGRYSMKVIMEYFGLTEELDSISKIHGKVFETKSFKIIPLYHPAVAVYNANMKESLKEDFKILKNI